MKRLFKIFAVASLFAFYSCNETRREQDQDSNEVAEEANDERFDDNEDMEKDADFVAEAVASNYAEIEMAKLAQERATHPQVKEIAQMLERDHKKTLDELKTLAQTEGITVPVEPKQDAKDQMAKLREEKAEDFDKKWLSEMEDKHEKSIDKFEKRAEKGEDPEVKALAAKTLPHLKMHKERISAALDQIEGNDSGSASARSGDETSSN